MESLKSTPLVRWLLLLTASTVAVGATATMRTSATFTAEAQVSQAAVSSSTLTLSVPGAGATNRLTLGASNIVPGDTMQRIVDLTNGGDDDLSAIVLTTTAPTTSDLDTDATHGLQITIDKCSSAWTESGSSPAFTYTCDNPATTSSVLASRAVIGSSLALSNLSALTAGSTDHLRVRLTLPATAGNTFQGDTSAITYTFTGTQRAATDK